MAKYASRQADFPRLGLFEQALEGISDAQIEQALGSACQVADGYFADRYSLPLVWNFLALEEREADGTGSAVAVFDAERLSLALDVTEIEEGVTLSVSIEESEDGTTGWAEVALLTYATAESGHITLETAITQKFVRVVWALFGTGKITFGVSWDGDDLKGALCDIAAYKLMSARGLDIGGRDEILVKRHDDALKWFKDIRAAKSSPQWIDQTPSDDTNTGAFVVSKKNRRWV